MRVPALSASPIGNEKSRVSASGFKTVRTVDLRVSDKSYGWGHSLYYNGADLSPPAPKFGGASMNKFSGFIHTLEQL